MDCGNAPSDSTRRGGPLVVSFLFRPESIGPGFASSRGRGTMALCERVCKGLGACVCVCVRDRGGDLCSETRNLFVAGDDLPVLRCGYGGLMGRIGKLRYGAVRGAQREGYRSLTGAQRNVRHWPTLAQSFKSSNEKERLQIPAPEGKHQWKKALGAWATRAQDPSGGVGRHCHKDPMWRFPKQVPDQVLMLRSVGRPSKRNFYLVRTLMSGRSPRCASQSAQ